MLPHPASPCFCSRLAHEVTLLSRSFLKKESEEQRYSLLKLNSLDLDLGFEFCFFLVCSQALCTCSAAARMRMLFCVLLCLLLLQTLSSCSALLFVLLAFLFPQT